LFGRTGLDGGVLELCSFPDDHDDGHHAQGWILLLHWSRDHGKSDVSQSASRGKIKVHATIGTSW
jgi:hypothetical protein